jgi:hypothetical protein
VERAVLLVNLLEVPAGRRHAALVAGLEAPTGLTGSDVDVLVGVAAEFRPLFDAGDGSAPVELIGAPGCSLTRPATPPAGFAA